MKRMLINATQTEEQRLAIVDGNKLLDYETETEGKEQRKGNIYKGIITRIEPSLEACFVDYGEERQGFLSYREISKQYFVDGALPNQTSIEKAVYEGQELIIQVDKEERGNKGASLTSFISLAGRYVVLMPNNPRGGGVSRRLEGQERLELKETMEQLVYPRGMSIIVRTAGIGRQTEELQWDLDYLIQLWQAIEGASKSNHGAFLIYQESSLVIRAIRDYFTNDIREILIDSADVYKQAKQFMQHVMPENSDIVKKYSDDIPLFSRFQLENQIESAHTRTVELPSGGNIVLDHCEALVAVDVNSARAIRGGDIEETALKTNIEAADEVARQIRLRDLGGLIVIDFIDMIEAKNRREVENYLRDALYQDRARVQITGISRFGLLEISRQRLKPALSEGAHVNCPRCGGSGYIRDTESSALQILRVIQESAMKENTASVHCQVPVDVASFLLNEKRNEISKLEIKQRINILLIPNKMLETPHYKLDLLTYDDPRLENINISYKLADEIEDKSIIETNKSDKLNKQKPIIKNYLPEDIKPVKKINKNLEEQLEKPEKNKKLGNGFLDKIRNFFFNLTKDDEVEEPLKSVNKEEKTYKKSYQNNRFNKRNNYDNNCQKNSSEFRKNNYQKNEKNERNNFSNSKNYKKNFRNNFENSSEEFKFNSNKSKYKEFEQNNGFDNNRKTRDIYRRKTKFDNLAEENKQRFSEFRQKSNYQKPNFDEFKNNSKIKNTENNLNNNLSDIKQNKQIFENKSNSLSSNNKIKLAKLPKVLPKAEDYNLPVEDLINVASSVGLKWIKSDKEKIALIQNKIANEPELIHIPRERKEPKFIDDSNLILVETIKDLKQLNSVNIN